jgi:hypothetical protein
VSIGVRDRTNPWLQTGTDETRAGVAFASGWPEKGSVFGCTSAQVRPAELFSADQWMGANSEPAAAAHSP